MKRILSRSIKEKTLKKKTLKENHPQLPHIRELRILLARNYKKDLKVITYLSP